MSTARAGMGGHKPKAKIQPADPNQPPMPRGVQALSEKEKYEKMWTVEDYRKVSPGELAGNTFLSVVKPDRDSHVIDFGCGTGRGSFYLNFMGGMKTTMVDFASNCLDQDVKNALKNYPERFDFIEHDLTKKIPVSGPYGYCTDVMEHIPEEDVTRVLYNILASARQVFFRISTEPDVMGPKYLKQHLHLTVQDYGWWCQKFIDLGCSILYSEECRGFVDFYVTCWKQDLPEMEVNTDQEKILANIKENAKWGCKDVMPHQVQEDKEILILSGGPSLNEHKEEILQKYHDKVPVVTVNGAYNWCLENGMEIVNQCVLDARPHNRRFVEPVMDKCNYFIGSGADPSVFEGLPPERTYYWHVYGFKEAMDLIRDEYENATVCVGGSTVTLRAIVLMRILGFRKQTLYGFDSCLGDDGTHHAYDQPENSGDPSTIHVKIETDDGHCRTFVCQPWMALQAFEFIRMMDYAREEFSLTVKGDGLIAYILETGAQLPPLEEMK